MEEQHIAAIMAAAAAAAIMAAAVVSMVQPEAVFIFYRRARYRRCKYQWIPAR